MKPGRMASVFIDGEELEDVGTITVEFNRQPAYPDMDCKHIDDMYHKCHALGKRRVLIDSYTLRAIVDEVLASREVLMTNKGVIDQADKDLIDKVTHATDTALLIGARS